MRDAFLLISVTNLHNLPLQQLIMEYIFTEYKRKNDINK